MSKGKRKKLKNARATPAAPTQLRAPKKSDPDLLMTVFLGCCLVVVVLVLSIREAVPDASELMYSEGPLEYCKQVGIKRPRTVFKLKNQVWPFQPSVLPDKPRVKEVFRQNSIARVGHTSENAGITDYLQVYSLIIDGKEIYSLEEYRVWADAKRLDEGKAVAVLGTAAIASYYFLRRRSRKRKLALAARAAIT